MKRVLKDDFRSVIISLEVGGEPALLVLLSRDGAVHRGGDGTYASAKGTPRQWRDDGTTFQAFMDQVDNDFVDEAGEYESSDLRGLACRLDIFFTADNDDSPHASKGFTYIFGYESPGPHARVRDLVKVAMSLTDAIRQ